MTECTALPCSSTTPFGGLAFEIINANGTAIAGRGGIGVVGDNSVGTGYGLYGFSNTGTGVIGISSSGSYGVWGSHTKSFGVFGQSNSSVGVFGQSNSSIGVIGRSETGYGVYGAVGSSSGYAGVFVGRVYVSGLLIKAGGGFKIDHPIDSANKYLNHSFVESSEMKNVYDGVVTLDSRGEAVVHLPDWFEALNQHFRYQLTCIGEYAPIFIAKEIERSRLRNSFKIAGGRSGMKVSWQVTGIRKDAWANANQILVEEEKSAEERGYYLHPEVCGQPEDRSVEWASNPELMRQMREQIQNPPSIAMPEMPRE
jgi:hypothetical protein